TDPEMQNMFLAINELLTINERYGVVMARERMLANRVIQNRRDFMNREFVLKGSGTDSSPLTATQVIDTEYLLNTLSDYESARYSIGELLRGREETVIYKV